MTTYRVWDPDQEDEEDGREYTNSYDKGDAATDYAEYRCGRDTDDYGYFAGGVELCVRNLDDNKLYTVPVECRDEPTLYAAKKREKTDG